MSFKDFDHQNALSPPQRLQLVNNGERENWGAVNGRALFFPSTLRVACSQSVTVGGLCGGESKTLILARNEAHDPRTRVASLLRLILLIQIVLRPCSSPDPGPTGRSLQTILITTEPQIKTIPLTRSPCNYDVRQSVSYPKTTLPRQLLNPNTLLIIRPHFYVSLVSLYF